MSPMAKLLLKYATMKIRPSGLRLRRTAKGNAAAKACGFDAATSWIFGWRQCRQRQQSTPPVETVRLATRLSVVKSMLVWPLAMTATAPWCGSFVGACGLCDGDGPSRSGCDGMAGSGLFADACGGYRDDESSGSGCANVEEVCGSDDAPTCIDCAGVANDNAVAI